MTMPTWRFPSLGGRSGRMLALLATSGLLGLSGVVAGGATPARADTFFVELSASPPSLAVNQSTTLTATTGTDVGPTPWYIDIYDMTANKLLRACGSGVTCSVNVTEGLETTHAFVAYVGAPSPAPPPSNLQGTSNTAFVTRTLRHTRDPAGPGGQRPAGRPGYLLGHCLSNVLLTRAFYG